MPLYEYQCAKCGAVIEVRQKFSDDPLTVHDSCGGDLTKLISASAFQLKGSGWYVTDYARGSSSSRSDESKGQDIKTEGTKSESTKSEGTKSEGAKSDSGGSASDSKPAAPSSSPKPSSSDKSD